MTTTMSEQSQELLASLLPGVRGDRERRNNRRHVLDVSAQVLLVGPPARLLGVTVRDLAVNGIGLRSAREFSPGERFVYAFRRESQTVLVLAEVRHCRALRDKMQSVGARFLDAQRVAAGSEVVPIEWLGITIKDGSFVGV